jgi:hypothetical protein
LEESSLWLGCSSSTLFGLPQTGLSCRDFRPVTPLFAHIGSCIGSGRRRAVPVRHVALLGVWFRTPRSRLSCADCGTGRRKSRDISGRDVVCTFIHTITTMGLSASTSLSLPNSIIGRLSIRAYAERNGGVKVQKHLVSRYSGVLILSIPSPSIITTSTLQFLMPRDCLFRTHARPHGFSCFGRLANQVLQAQP